MYVYKKKFYYSNNRGTPRVTITPLLPSINPIINRMVINRLKQAEIPLKYTDFLTYRKFHIESDWTESLDIEDEFDIGPSDGSEEYARR